MRFYSEIHGVSRMATVARQNALAGLLLGLIVGLSLGWPLGHARGYSASAEALRAMSGARSRVPTQIPTACCSGQNFYDCAMRLKPAKLESVCSGILGYWGER